MALWNSEVNLIFCFTAISAELSFPTAGKRQPRKIGESVRRAGWFPPCLSPSRVKYEALKWMMNELKGRRRRRYCSLLSLFHSIVTLHSAPLNRNRHSQGRREGWKKRGLEVRYCFGWIGAMSEKQDFLSLPLSPIEHSTSVSQLWDLICFWLIGDFNVWFFFSPSFQLPMFGLDGKWGWNEVTDGWAWLSLSFFLCSKDSWNRSIPLLTIPDRPPQISPSVEECLSSWAMTNSSRPVNYVLSQEYRSHDNRSIAL